MNQHDSEILAGLLEKAGYRPVSELESADVILFNTCCVREHAEQRLYSRISQLKSLKAEKRGLVLGVGGCVAQKQKDALTRKFPHVDIVFGTNAITDICTLIEQVEREEGPVVSTPEYGPDPRSDIAAPTQDTRIRAWVSVMRGCDNYCSYCVVPYVRGRQRSKPPEEVIDEIETLADKGFLEITLLGQNVNSYGQDLDANVSFADLLTSLNDVPGIRRIRFTTSHPKDISADLMHAVRDLPKVCEHLHLPVQSGSTRILERMNRGYSAEQYLAIIDKLRELIPDISLTTDVIVGFPGETEADFQETGSLLERVRFDGAYIFKYSPRPGTAAEDFEGELDKDTLKHRHRSLLTLQKKISMETLQDLVGTAQSLLPEHVDSKRPDHVLGRTRGYRVASIHGKRELIGQEIAVRIRELNGWTLIGETIQSE